MSANAASTFGQRRVFWLVLLALVLLRVPYYLTHHIQEDAYIVFRTAFNLADHGDYSFNLGERTPGMTSTVHPLLVALLRLLFRDWAIPALQVLYTLLVVIGARLLAVTLVDDERARLAFWMTSACLPAALFVSYFGMETGLLLFDLCLVLYGLRLGRVDREALTGIFLLPLIRPDAISFGAIFIAAALLFDRKGGVRAAIALAAGVAALLLFTFVTTGDFLATTIEAKEVAARPDRSLGAVVRRLVDIFVSDSFLMPLSTKYLLRAAPLFPVVAGIGAFGALRAVWHDRVRRVLVAAMIAGAVLVPAAYAYGGVVMEWYLLPSNWLAYVLIAFAAVCLIARLPKRTAMAMGVTTALLVAAFAVLRLVVSFNIGTQEAYYRAGIGRYLASRARPSDTLILEPAGYIPFYAGLRTFDEIGLVSRLVIRYRSRYGAAWWIRFLQDEHPTYIVIRTDIEDVQRTFGYEVTPQQIEWFRQNYADIARFHYDPHQYFADPLLLRALELGSHSDYFVFAYKSGTSAAPRVETSAVPAASGH